MEMIIFSLLCIALFIGGMAGLAIVIYNIIDAIDYEEYAYAIGMGAAGVVVVLVLVALVLLFVSVVL